MEIQHFYDERTSTLSYAVFDRAERIAVVIDPVLDFDPASGRTWTESADAIAAFLDANQLAVRFVLDTHAHADHLSAMPYFKSRFGAESAIGARIVEVQREFRELFNFGGSLAVDGSQFDVLLEDGDVLDVGPFQIEAFHTPGHTPACMSYRVEDALFVGDTLFMPDYGTARCDFPGGSAGTLYESIQKLYRTLPPGVRVFTCHDYQPGGRELRFESTILEQKKTNAQLSQETGREEFIRFREQRDATLSMPRLMLPSIQVNVRAGELPAAESNGLAYLKLPLNAFGRSE